MKTENSNFLLNPVLWLFLSLTLGLAPFLPEPHLWEKLKWIVAGAEGMRLLDWLDFFLHSSPWVMLVYSLNKKYLSH